MRKNRRYRAARPGKPADLKDRRGSAVYLGRLAAGWNEVKDWMDQHAGPDTFESVQHFDRSLERFVQAAYDKVQSPNDSPKEFERIKHCILAIQHRFRS